MKMILSPWILRENSGREIWSRRDLTGFPVAMVIKGIDHCTFQTEDDGLKLCDSLEEGFAKADELLKNKFILLNDKLNNML